MKSLHNIQLLMVMSLVFCGQTMFAMDADMAGQALWNAARLGNLENVQAAIAAGANVNTANNAGITPLMFALWGRNLGIVQALILAGLDVNVRNDNGGTALMSAACFDHLGIVQALIAAGADVNLVDNDGGTALICAVCCNSLNIVEALIAAGADVNARGIDDDMTLLMYAALEGSLEMVQAIINADGFDPDQLQPIIDYLHAKENKKPVEQEILDILQERQTFNPMGLK